MLTTSRPSLRKKVAKYLTEGLELDVPNLSLPRMWFRKVSAKQAEGTGEVMPTAVMPYLVLVAHRDVALKPLVAKLNATFQLCLLVANLHSRMLVRVVQMVSLLFACDSLTVSTAWELISVSMFTSQGDGFNTSLSRLMYYTHALLTSRLLTYLLPVFCVVIFRGTVMCHPGRRQ